MSEHDISPLPGDDTGGTGIGLGGVPDLLLDTVFRLAGQNGDTGPPGGGPDIRSIPIGNGLVAVQYWDGQQWVTLEGGIRNAPTGGGAGPTGAELDIDRRRNDLIARGQDIDLQIATATQELQAAQLELDRLNSDRNLQISLGQIELATTTEARIREFAQKTHELNQQIFALDQQRTAINAQIDAANALGTMGADLGDLEFRRDELLANLAANPRDFNELQLQLGGDNSFIDQLLGNEAVTGRSTRLIGESVLGPAWESLVASLNQRPELDFFDQAADRLSGIPGFDVLSAQQPQVAPPGAPPPAAPPQANVVDAQLAAQQGDIETAEEIARRVLQGV